MGAQQVGFGAQCLAAGAQHLGFGAHLAAGAQHLGAGAQQSFFLNSLGISHLGQLIFGIRHFFLPQASLHALLLSQALSWQTAGLPQTGLGTGLQQTGAGLQQTGFGAGAQQAGFGAGAHGLAQLGFGAQSLAHLGVSW